VKNQELKLITLARVFKKSCVDFGKSIKLVDQISVFMKDQVTILGFAGSLRKGSFNKALLRTAVELAPEDVKIETFDLEGIPPFNQDFERTPPAIVKEFKARIRTADAVLIVTPEYNYGVPGVLKNAIDWASRPYGDNAFDGKPVALMSASTGMLGGARAQYQLRQTFVTFDMHAVNRPEVFVAHVNEKISEDGKVTDEDTVKKVRKLIENLANLSRKLNQ
jgi:chromate reductase